MEYVRPNLLVDCAHNPAAAACLRSELEKVTYDRLVLVLGIMADKDIKGICQALVPLAHEVILTKPKIQRAASPQTLKQCVPKGTIIEDVASAVAVAQSKATDKDLVVVTGSLFTVAEALRALAS